MADELIEVYALFIEQYPIYSIEDGFADRDWVSCGNVAEFCTASAIKAENDEIINKIVETITSLNACMPDEK